ncbi:MAG: hypothetical protein AAF849_23860 [Bacteroidota bacterium]
MKFTKKEGGLFLLFLVLCYFPIFHHLGVPPIKGWDESLFGMRMLHFYETGDYLPAFKIFPGEVPHQNLKPPLMTFVQSLSFGLLGGQDLELSLRLPIALCVLGTVLLLLWYSKKESNHLWWGMIAAVVLLTSEGYTRVHVGRTGDHDAALAFFMLIGMFAFFRYVHAEDSKTRNRQLLVLTAMLLISFLTKSIVGFFFVPGFIIYAAMHRQLLPILKRPATYIAAFSLFSLVAIYYFLMDTWHPGFLKGIREHALGRYTQSLGHNHPFDFYFKRYQASSFRIWVYFLPLAIALVFSSKLKQFRNIGQLAFFCATPYLLIISFSETKLPWYDAPMYPLLSILVAIAIYQVLQALMNWSKNSAFFPSSSWILYALCFLFLVPYVRIVKQFSHFKLSGNDEQFAYMMKRIEKNRGIQDYYICAQGQYPQLSFYTGYYNKIRGYDLNIVKDMKMLAVGDEVMLCQNSRKKILQESFEYETLEQYGKRCHFVRLKSKKE